MGIGTNPDYDQAFAAALDWWRQAGVDCAFEDAPRSWLPDPQEPESASGKKPARARRIEVIEQPDTPAPLILPQDLESFHAWWMTTSELDPGSVSSRVAPRGDANPALMILAATPEDCDRERLLSGPEGGIIDAFLQAAQVPENDVYRASVLPCHSPGADWSPEANRVAAEALARHIALVRPQRILVLGFIILPLLGHDSPQVPAVSLDFKHEGASTPMLALRRIPAAASRPRWKAALWQAWLEWTSCASPDHTG
ncbi:hypothetical protein [Novosphingobium sp. M1R2S20]|uniref:Uracil-DNA glycosylase-like domain-containing protein n=1 Tax=Novosphingobium rhizovicinum TaxID=3228928 RepID=A0ABV3R6G8_9SPHN